MRDELDEADKLRALLALEVHRIVEDLELRRTVLLELWGRTRDRGMFLDTVFSRWASLGFPDLLVLNPEEVVLVDTFYRELHELRFYFRFTEDMPVTLSDTYDLGLLRLKGYGELVLDAFGGPPVRPFIEFPEEEPRAADAVGLFVDPLPPEEGDLISEDRTVQDNDEWHLAATAELTKLTQPTDAEDEPVEEAE